MSKFKVLGVFIALIYSFFSYTVSHSDDYSVRENVFTESQIRKLDKKTEDALISVVRPSTGEQSSIPEDQPSLGFKMVEFSIFPKRKPEKVQIKTEKQLFYRSLAIERYRVLRN